MNDTLRNVYLVVQLPDSDYIQMKVAVAKANTTLKDWVAKAIMEKLDKENNNDNR